ncbi:hypothetical protein FQA39_LY08138 [Lamprigera yunnana]|nr:hypothetical protein FQA39_LY08138 [Lamprigera yunnana]
MKNIIFCVYVLVLNVSCIELDVTSIGFEDCLLGIINQNFVEDRTICFINDESYNLTVPNKLSNPYIVVNIDKNTLLSLKCQHNFVIFTKNVASLTELMRNLTRSVLWSRSSSPRSKFLVITDESDVSKIFRKLFYFYIIDLIVMVPSNTSNHMVYVSNPFEDGNKCGRYFSVFNQSCSATTLNLIRIPLKNLGGCPITYYRNTVDTVTALRNMVLLVLEELGFRINATVGEQGSKLFNSIKLTPYYDIASDTLDYTKIMYRDNWMWLTPSPIRVFPIETLVELFQSEVWIFTLIVIVWWSAVLLKNCTNKLAQFSQVFIDIVSLSLLGTINLIPKTKTLCYLLLIYSLYVMVIQTAYKTNLTYVLTLPQYSNKITSSKEIIQQKLPVYAHGVFYAIFQKKNCDFKPLLNLCYNHSTCMDSIYNYRNSVLLMPEVVFSSIVTKDENSVENKFNFFIDNHQIGMLPIVFLLQNGHFILANLNKIITELDESGIFQYKFKGNYRAKDLVEENMPLKLIDRDAEILKENTDNHILVFSLEEDENEASSEEDGPRVDDTLKSNRGKMIKIYRALQVKHGRSTDKRTFLSCKHTGRKRRLPIGIASPKILHTLEEILDHAIVCGVNRKKKNPIWKGTTHNINTKTCAGLDISTLDTLVRLKLLTVTYDKFDYSIAYKLWTENFIRGRNIGQKCKMLPLRSVV